MKSEAFPTPGSPLLVGRILLYADDYVAEWMGEQMGTRIIPPYTAFGVVSAHGQLVGGVVINEIQEASCEVSIVAPKRVSRSLLRVTASYVFDTLGCNRVTARTRASTLKVRKFIEKVGFRQEGILRAFYEDGDDAVLFGMLRNECRW